VIFRAIPNEGAGCIAYLVGCEREGVAAVVDPGRADVEPCLALARAKGLRIVHVLDTHLHADHVSGARELAEAAGADVGLHEAADVRYPHAALRDGQRLRLGSVELRVLHTPGHTPESMCLVVTDTSRGEEPWFVLTGDTLFVGDVGRPDFGGETAAAELHRSLFERLLPLGDAVEVYPAHGAGSLCGRAMSSKVGSTIGFERRFNAALRHAGADAFVRALVEGLPPRPPSMDRIIAKNRGIVMLEHPAPARLAAGDVAARLGAGAVLVDCRDPRHFGAGHAAGSLNVSLDAPQFAERVAWFVPPGARLVLVLEGEADVGRAVPALSRVGLDEIEGYLIAGDLPATGLPLGTLPNVTPPELARRLDAERDLVVLDVREPSEWAEGHVPGARHVPMREVTRRIAEVPRDRPVAIMCAGGARSSLVASVLRAHGHTDLVNVWGGMTAWTQTGLPVARD
jgi:glyoxylase-like metal-dependent hydrolase (beta-lactamase superfamily II)/rhodanese-related sulfurtransferase